jgi:hypothetical protein
MFPNIETFFLTICRITVRDGILGAEKEPCSLVMDGKALAHALELQLDEDLVRLGEYIFTLHCQLECGLFRFSLQLCLLLFSLLFSIHF